MMEYHLFGIPTIPDWRYFDIIGSTNTSESAQLIKQVPIHRYWDTGKASFKTGILPDYIIETYPDLVSTMDIKITRHGKPLIFPNAKIVDQNILFDHMINAIQYLAKEMNMLYDSILFLNSTNNEFQYISNQLNNVLDIDWLTVSDIITERKIKVSQSEILEVSIQKAKEYHDLTRNFILDSSKVVHVPINFHHASFISLYLYTLGITQFYKHVA
jgi:hypothetical protein